MRELLDVNNEKEHEYLNALHARDDTACGWIQDDSTFQRWKSPSIMTTRNHLLALFGLVGSGKTTLVSYVIDRLKEEETTVLFYFCKDDGERNKVESVYRSILLQMFTARPELIEQLVDWDEYKSTRSDKNLRQLCVDIFLRTEGQIFLVVDAIDECERQAAISIVQFLDDLCILRPAIKTFITARTNNTTMVQLPEHAMRLNIEPSRISDRSIAMFMVKCDLSKVARLHGQLADHLSSRAQGCANWIKVAVKYLETFINDDIFNRHSDEQILSALDSVSYGLSGSEWPELYGRLYHRSVSQKRDMPNTLLLIDEWPSLLDL